MAWKFHNQVLIQVAGSLGRWQERGTTVKFTSKQSTINQSIIYFIPAATYNLDLFLRDTEERPGWCTDPYLPPCASYVLSHLPSSYYIIILPPSNHEWKTWINQVYLNGQVCGDYGNRIFTRCMALCLVYDPGNFNLLFLSSFVTISPTWLIWLLWFHLVAEWSSSWVGFGFCS